MAVPVFVLGLQRSGTTWVANLLASSDAIAAVTAEEHRGVHESIFFSHFATAFGPFENADARSDFRAAFAASDYFLLSELSEAVLDDAIAQATDYAGVFAKVMDALAAREGCAFWLEKSPHHTRLAENLAQRFPDAWFVCVTRSSNSLISSRLAAFGRTPPRRAKRAADILRGTLVNSMNARRLRRFAADCDRALLLRYEDLLADEPGGKHDLSEFLRLRVAPDTMRSSFAPNSSHRNATTRHLSSFDRVLIALGDLVGWFLPLRLLIELETRRQIARGVDWPDWVWVRSGFRPS